MTREEYQKIIMEDRKGRNFYGQSLQVNNNNSSVGISKVPNNKIETQKVGAEQYNSAPINIVEPKKLVQNNTSKIDTWLEPSYKLSKDEEKEAKAYVKQWYKENAGFKNNPYKSQHSTQELQKVAELNSKLSGGTAAWAGFTNAIPFLENIQDKISNAFGGETSDAVSKNREALEASKMQNPGAAIAGNVAGEIAKYSAGGELLRGAGLIGESGKLTKGVSKVIKNPKVAGSVANILGDTTLDVALDTIPHLAEDISKGDEKAGANALKNVGTNLAFNTLGEGVGIVGGKVIGKLADKKQLGKADSLNPVESYVKKSDEIAKESDDLQEQMMDSSKKLSDSLSKEKMFDDFTKETGIKLEGSEEEKSKILGFFKNKVKKYSAVEEKMPEISNFVDELVANRGQTRYPHNQLRINKVPEDVAQMVKDASDGRINISDKYFAMEAGKMFHELEKHGNAAIEESRSQLPINSNDIKELAYTMIDPDLVQSISNGLKAEQRDVFALAKSVDGNGYIVIVEAVGGKRNPNIVPEQVLKLKESKMKKVLDGDVSIADLVYENSNRKGNVDGNVLDIKKRVTAAQLAQSAPVHTSETYQRSPLLNNSISKLEENVNAITDYKKINIPNHDEMSKNIDKFIGMYGDDAAKTKALEYKQSINNFLENYSEEAWEEVANNANELDRMLQGKTYTYKNQGKAKNKSNVRQAKYDKEIRDILTYETDNLIKEAEENALKKSNVVKESVSTPIVKTSDDAIEKEMAKSRYASETVVNKTDIPDEVKNEFRENPKMYEVVKNKDTDARANEIFENNDFNTAYAEFDRLLEDRDPISIPLGYKLAKQLAESGATQQAVDIVDKMSERLTKAGQFTQSAAITMLQGDPMASMRYMQKQLQKMNVTGAEQYKNWKKLELTEDEVKAFSNIEPQDKEAIMELYGKIEDRLAKEYPSSTWEKVVELSKTSMMLHSRTHIRNIASNAIMVPVRSLSDRVSALGQNAVKLFKPDLEVTQSLTGGTSAQKKIANQIFDNQIKPLLDDSGKWNNVSGNVPRNKQVFKDSKIGAAAKKGFVWSASQANNLTGGKLENLVNTLDKSMTDSVLENLRKFDYWLLGEVEDNPFVKKNFSNRLASYMKAQNISDIDAVPNEAVQIAYQEALKATFKDDNTMTKAFSNLKGLFGKFGEVAMPFTKTPANIAMRGIDYSPAGIVNAIKQAKNGDDISRVMDTVAKSATGTAGILLGYKLAENGLIQGALSSDTDKQQFEKQQGKVAYSIKVGDNYISFDFAQPAAIPIIIGTTIHDSVKESDMDAEKLFNTAYQATGAAFNSWLELSPLQSLQDMLGGSGYGENNVFENIANETLEFPQRLIPSMLGASARTVDPVYRQTYSKGNVLQTQIDTAKAKIPGLSEQLPISYDTWGNPRRRQDNTMSAAIANFINPGTLGYDASTPIDGEIERLFESTQSNSVFPQKASWSVKNKNGDTMELTNEQYSRYQKEMGQTSYSIAETVINSDYYNNLPDEDKAECLSLIYSISKADTNNKMFGTKVADKTKKYVDVYNMNGPEGLVNYLQRKHDFDSLDVDMSGKKAQEAYKNGGKEGLEEFATFKNTAETLGLSINSEAVNKVYETGGIPYLKQYSTYKTKADKDGNGRLKKEEVASYLNASGLSQEEKRYWFSVLYTGTSKNPY